MGGGGGGGVNVLLHPGTFLDSCVIFYDSGPSHTGTSHVRELVITSLFEADPPCLG